MNIICLFLIFIFPVFDAHAFLPVSTLLKTAKNIPITMTGMPAWRRNMGITNGGGYGFVFGGCLPGDPSNCATGTFNSNGYYYNLSTNTWTAMTTTGAPSPRSHACVGYANNRFLVFGGWNGSAYLSDGAIFNIGTGTWTAMSGTNAPSARYRCHTTTAGTQIFTYGGLNGVTVLGSGHLFDPVTNTWTVLSTTNEPGAINEIAPSYTGTYVILWGGHNGTSSVNTGKYYNIGSNTWTTMAASPLTAYSWPWVAWDGTSLAYIVGGSGSAATFNPATNVWTSIATHPLGNSGHAFVSGGRVYNTASASVYFYNIATNSWHKMPGTGKPKYGATIVCGLFGSEFRMMGIGGSTAQDFAAGKMFIP
jgi:N-acetylneuraminic acid mutarotase